MSNKEKDLELDGEESRLAEWRTGNDKENSGDQKRPAPPLKGIS